MRFYVYINEPTNKARIHVAECAFCNDGEGMVRDKSPYNGRWCGPFFSDREAVTCAKNSGKADIRWCKWCARTIGIAPELE